MQWGVTLSSLLGKIEQVMAIGLSRYREQALDEPALAGEDSSLRRHLRSTSRSNWAKDRSTLSVSRPNTGKIGLFCPSGASLPDEFRCNSSSSVRRAPPVLPVRAPSTAQAANRVIPRDSSSLFASLKRRGRSAVTGV
jgi:hypothetical protein